MRSEVMRRFYKFRRHGRGQGQEVLRNGKDVNRELPEDKEGEDGRCRPDPPVLHVSASSLSTPCARKRSRTTREYVIRRSSSLNARRRGLGKSTSITRSTRPGRGVMTRMRS